jgi:hypothetical protein
VRSRGRLPLCSLSYYYDCTTCARWKASRSRLTHALRDGLGCFGGLAEAGLKHKAVLTGSGRPKDGRRAERTAQGCRSRLSTRSRSRRAVRCRSGSGGR